MTGVRELSTGPGLVIVLAAGCVAGVVAWVLPPPALDVLMREHGPVENATVLLYVLAAGAALCVRTSLRAVDRAAVACVLLGCMAREVSLRKLLNAQLGGYCCTPEQTRLILGVLLVLCVAAGAWLVARYLRLARSGGVSIKSPVWLTLAAFGVALVVSQVCDGLPKLWPVMWGQPLGPQAAHFAWALEETLEMTLPILAICGLGQARRSRVARGRGIAHVG